MSISGLFISANPALGTVYTLDNFTIGAINRLATRSTSFADGKAVTAAVVFKLLGGQPTVLLPCGGVTGRLLLESLHDRRVPAITVAIQGEVRRTFTLLVTSGSRRIETQLLEPGPELTPSDESTFLTLARQASASRHVVALSGSLPPGLAVGFFATLIRTIREASPEARIALDTCGAPLCEAVAAAPDILKINREEFGALRGIAPAATRDLFLAEMERVGQTHGIGTVIVTRGADAALAWSSKEGFFEAVPPVVETVNTEGAGDCFMAGLLVRLAHGISASLRRGVASGTANVLSTVPGDVTRCSIDTLEKDIKVIRLGP